MAAQARRISSREFASLVSSNDTKKVQLSRDLEDLGSSGTPARPSTSSMSSPRPSQSPGSKQSDFSTPTNTHRTSNMTTHRPRPSDTSQQYSDADNPARQSFVHVESSDSLASDSPRSPSKDIRLRSNTVNSSNSRSTLQNTMRKTSGFFKKSFFLSKSSSSHPNGSPSGDGMRTSVSASPLPPAPVIPSKYSAPSASPPSSKGPLPKSPESQSSSTSRSLPHNPQGNRKRSVSLNSTGDVFSSATTLHNTNTESERLKAELNEWSLSVEGFLKSRDENGSNERKGSLPASHSMRTSPPFPNKDLPLTQGLLSRSMPASTSAAPPHAVHMTASRSPNRNSDYISASCTDTNNTFGYKVSPSRRHLNNRSLSEPGASDNKPSPTKKDDLIPDFGKENTPLALTDPSTPKPSSDLPGEDITNGGSDLTPNQSHSGPDNAAMDTPTKAKSLIADGTTLAPNSDGQIAIQAEQDGQDTPQKKDKPSDIPDDDDDDTPKIRLVPSTSNFQNHSGQSETESLDTPTKDSSSIPGSPTQSHPTTPRGSVKQFSRPDSRQSVVVYPMASSTHAQGSLSRGSTTGSLRSNYSTSPNPSNVHSNEFTGDEDPAEIADKIYNRDYNFMKKENCATFLGSREKLNREVLKLYIAKFDFKGERLDYAFRRLCQYLYLKAETQQIDRILEQFSIRYFETNPENIYGTEDVVHAITYSLLLLNTDLHVVEGSARMSARQFINNTMGAIKSQEGDVPPSTPTTSPLRLTKTASGSKSSHSRRPSTAPSREDKSRRESYSSPSRTLESKRLSFRPSINDTPLANHKNGTGSEHGQSKTALSSPENNTTGGDLVRSTPQVFHSHTPSDERRSNSSQQKRRSSDYEVEQTLKEMYSSIKAKPIFQSQGLSGNPESRSSLSLGNNGQQGSLSSAMSRMSNRRSQQSLAGSDRGFSLASGAHKRASFRGLLSPSSTSGESLSLQRSLSPTPTTLTEPLAESSSDITQTIGFASNLSHTIIREQKEDDDTKPSSNGDIYEEVDDEELALLGPPWAKEGLLQRKHYWETDKKRSKDKSWQQVFVVIQKGELQMFKFGQTSPEHKLKPGNKVGGGNWSNNAHLMGNLVLTHALSSAMPPPGYSKDRPHVFVLTLPSGSSFFFQAGTQDLVNEWVQTCNYWAARFSKEPLTGGVSNVDYGWNAVEEDGAEEVIENPGVSKDSDSIGGHSRRSTTASMSMSFQSARGTGSRVQLGDWKAPEAPTQRSTLPEENQLESLKRYIDFLQEDLRKHNALRKGMMNLYSPRSAQYTQSRANWERKSKYLLGEIFKIRTYVEALSNAIDLRDGRRGEQQVAQLLETADAQADGDDDDTEICGVDEDETKNASRRSNSVKQAQTPSPRSRPSMESAVTEETGDKFFEAKEDE